MATVREAGHRVVDNATVLRPHPFAVAQPHSANRITRKENNVSEPSAHPPGQPTVAEDEESRFAGIEDWIATIVGLALIAIVVAGLIPKGLVP